MKLDFTYNAKAYERNKSTVKSPLRYPGGKFYALKHIMPFIECVDHDEYREPFFGGGSVFFAKAKSQFNVINDLESDIMHLFGVIQDYELCETLCELVSREVATRERHAEIKEMDPNSSLTRAFKTFYLNRTSYSGIINTPAWGYAEGKSSPPKNWARFLRNASKKLQGVEIYSTDFSKIVELDPKGNTVLIYLDPPYVNADQKRAYTKPFLEEDHIRLAETLKKTPHHFCLSYDDCPEVREWYSWANIFDVSWLYNTDNSNGGVRKKGKELIITNYDVVF